MLSLSGHKIYAPKGVGALYVKNGIDFERFMDGGHQEKNRRSGTENVAEIVGLGKACEIAEKNLENYSKKLMNIRDYCLKRIQEKVPDIQVNGSLTKRLPGNLNISFKGIESEELLLKLDALGVCASGGSACSSGESTPSHVLTSIGVNNEMAKGTVRFSFGDFNTMEDVDYLIMCLESILKSI